MFTRPQHPRGGTAIETARAFRMARGKPGNLGMLTVYGYGFTDPEVEAAARKAATPSWGLYAVVAAAAWWAWRKWGRKAATS